jgi:magnesium transporter
MEERSIYGQGGRVSQRTITTADLAELASLDGLVWLDLEAPTAEELAAVGQVLGWDAHTMEDALAPRERPKILHLDRYSFLTTYALSVVGQRIQTSRLSAYLLGSALITIHPAGLDMDPFAARWQQDPHLVAWGTRGLLQGVMDVIVDQLFTILEALDTDCDDLSRLLFTAKPNTKLVQRQTFDLRHQLMTLGRVIPQTRDLVVSIMRQSLAEEWPTELRTYWGDVNDHILRASEWVESLRDLVTSIFEANLALNDSRMNEVMKKLAAWAAIIAVPTLITGWFGMNVPYPGFAAPFGLLLALGLVIVAVVTLFIVFKVHDWL